MRKFISITGKNYSSLWLQEKWSDSKEFEEATGLRYSSRRMVNGNDIFIFKVIDEKKYSYACIKYELQIGWNS